MAESRKRKTFDSRAATLLKQTRELATLCDSPVCIVIHNPNDVVKPYRIWPENEAEFRSVVQIYKNSKKRKRKNPANCNPSGGGRRRKADVRSRIANLGGGNGFSVPQLSSQSMDLTTTAIVPFQQQSSPPPSTLDRDLVMAGKGEECAGKERALFANNVDDDGCDAYYRFHSIATVSTTSTANANQFGNDDDDAGFNQLMMSCEWEDNEMFELEELLNGAGHEF